MFMDDFNRHNPLNMFIFILDICDYFMRAEPEPVSHPPTPQLIEMSTYINTRRNDDIVMRRPCSNQLMNQRL